ncbi:MAG: ATP-dependent RNA helicase ddx55, partial [Paramarteilia canceri]
MSHLKSTKFSSLSNILDDSLLRTLNKLNFQFLTLVQEKTLPLSILGRDVCATAPTGSGKTLAFVLPILQKLIKASKNSNEMALILQPTRELAIQTSEMIKLILKSGHFDNITEALIIGGTNKFDQKVLLGKGTNILVGTP